MKKILKVILLSLITIIVVGLFFLHISYHAFSPGDKGVAVDKNNLVYFQESYEDCRQAFLTEAKSVAAAGCRLPGLRQALRYGG